MIKRILALFLALTTVLLCFAGCGKKVTTDKKFVYPIESDPECLDPQIADNASAKAVINNCFEGLTRIGSDGNVIPGAAERWTVSENKLEYTFYIRRGLNWYANRAALKRIDDENYKIPAVTAHDFAFGLQRALSPETNAPDANLLYAIENAEEVHRGSKNVNSLGIQVIDDYTLKIKLSRRDDSFLQTLSMPVSMPCNQEFFKNAMGRYGLSEEYCLTNGPFYISKWNPDISVILTADKQIESDKKENKYDKQAKNRNCYKGEFSVAPASVTFTVKSDSSLNAQKLNDGVYDAAYVPEEHISDLSEKNVTKFIYPNITWGFFVNCNDAVLKNQMLRIALLQSTDISKIDLPAGSEPASGFIPPSCRVGDKSYREIAGNVSHLAYSSLQSRQNWDKGLEQAGLASAQITVLCSTEHEQLVRKLIQNWQSILGISLMAKLETVEPADLLNAANAGNYSIALLPIKADGASPVKFLNQFTNGKGYTKYNSAAFNNAVAKLQTVGDTNALAKGCKSAEEHLVKNGVILHLFSQSSCYAIRKDVEGIYFHPAAENIFFGLAEKEED